MHYPKEIVVPFTTYISKSLFGNLCSNSQLRHQSLLNITMNDWLFSHASSRHCLIYLVSSDKFTVLLKGLKSRIRRNLSKLCTCKNFTDISIIGIFFHELWNWQLHYSIAPWDADVVYFNLRDEFTKISITEQFGNILAFWK